MTPAVDTAFLYGNPNQPGFYVLMFKWKPGNASRFRIITRVDRHVVVLSGYVVEWHRHGLGSSRSIQSQSKPGTYVTHLARQVHYDGSRKGDPEPAVELVWGTGPVTTVVCDNDKGPGPCEDARRGATGAK